MATYFQALGVDRQTATVAVVKAAYRKLAGEIHPDLNPGQAEKWKLITAAYHELSDDEKLGKHKVGLVFGREQRQLDSWSRDWETLNGIKPEAPKTASQQPKAGFTADDIADFIRQTERMRREAQWLKRDEERRRAEAERQAQYAKCGYPTCDRDAVFGWQFCADHSSFSGNRAGEQPKTEREHAKAEGKCNTHTASGPCCRPAGHTPNGHMSQKVADQKRENQRMRKARGY